MNRCKGKIKQQRQTKPDGRKVPILRITKAFENASKIEDYETILNSYSVEKLGEAFDLMREINQRQNEWQSTLTKTVLGFLNLCPMDKGRCIYEFHKHLRPNLSKTLKFYLIETGKKEPF